MTSATDEARSRPGPALRSRFAILLLFAFLAAVHTWPLVTAPATWSRNDNADAALNEWTLAWVAHALATHPLRLFDANIFYPDRDTLAYSEHLVIQGIMGAPLAWLGASPVLVLNVVWLLGLALSGCTTALVLQRWTGSAAGGIVAGSAVAFNSLMFTHTMHVQAMHVEFLPVALYAFDRVLAAPRVRTAFGLSGAASVQMLCSGYLLVFTAVALVVSAVVRLGDVLRRERRGRRAAMLAGAGLLTMLIVLPFLAPYARVRATQGLVRTIAETLAFSASPSDYLATVGRLHYATWSARFYPAVDTLFPGGTVVLLAGIALATALRRDPRARTLAAIALAGAVLSFGPRTPIYRWLYDWVPVLQGLRGAARFGFLAIFGLSGLAAFGLARVLHGVSGPSRRRAVAVVAVLAVNVEAFTAPLYFVPAPSIPAVYDALATAPDAIVVEVPFPGPERFAANASVVLASTRYWGRLVNGYSGFLPPSYVEHARILGRFPSDEAFALLDRLGVTHVVTHVDEDPSLATALDADRRVAIVATTRAIRIYRIVQRTVGR